MGLQSESSHNDFIDLLYEKWYVVKITVFQKSCDMNVPKLEGDEERAPFKL